MITCQGSAYYLYLLSLWTSNFVCTSFVFRMPFCISLWQWFNCKIGRGVDLSSLLTLLCVPHNLSSQLTNSLVVGIVNVTWFIWKSRNKFSLDLRIVLFLYFNNPLSSLLLPYWDLYPKGLCVQPWRKLKFCRPSLSAIITGKS